MRIIAGDHRGRVILTPKGLNTRPTQGRIRESVFNIIRNEIPGAAVLDLFAGSGAFGFEAVSRGADFAVFVDHARESRDAIKRNIHALQMTEKTRLLCCDFSEALSRLRHESQRFDIVFIDPPYHQIDVDAMFSCIKKSGVMKPDALWIYEHAKRTAFSADGLVIEDERSYGDTSIAFIRKQPEA